MDKSICLIIGYIKDIDNINFTSCKLGLFNRFAFVLDTHKPGHFDMVFDYVLMNLLISELISYFDYDHLSVHFDKAIIKVREINDYYTTIPHNERDAFNSLFIHKNNKIIGYIECSFYCRVGGPPPYHDSYTFSCYLKQHDDLEVIKNLFYRICTANNIAISDCIVGLKSPKISFLEKIRYFLRF